MFEVGSRYDFRMVRNGEDHAFSGTIAAYEHPLIRLEDTVAPVIEINFVGSEPFKDISLSEAVAESYKEEPNKSLSMGGQTIKGAIINVTSLHFVSATPVA